MIAIMVLEAYASEIDKPPTEWGSQETIELVRRLKFARRYENTKTESSKNVH